MPCPNGIHCECARRITSFDVLEHAFVMRHWVPRFVRIKYQCPACGKIDEVTLDFKHWRPSILTPCLEDGLDDERERIAQLGPIDLDEIALFRADLGQLTGAQLLKTLEQV